MAVSWVSPSPNDQVEALEFAAARTGWPAHLLEEDLWFEVFVRFVKVEWLMIVFISHSTALAARGGLQCITRHHCFRASGKTCLLASSY